MEGFGGEEEKPRTLFVGNVPREVSKREVETLFGDIGPLKRCFIQYPRGGKWAGSEANFL
jgi:RNA recognition motif-containing protein